MANEQARALRKQQTEADARFWRAIKSKQLDGHKFRRQHPIGAFLVDFVCLEKRLIVELDGGQHGREPQKAYDERRDAWLKARGYCVLR